MKKCNKCGEVKPVTEYYKDNRCKDGLKYNCKICDDICKNGFQYGYGKYCKVCNIYKDMCEFYKRSDRKYKFENKCIECTKKGYKIDHIIPISSAKNIDEVIALNHWSNFQPLCAFTNRNVKRDKIPIVTNIELKINTLEYAIDRRNA